jgi:hypothetical protein
VLVATSVLILSRTHAGALAVGGIGLVVSLMYAVSSAASRSQMNRQAFFPQCF